MNRFFTKTPKSVILFTLGFSAFSLGIALEQIMLGLMVLWTMGETVFNGKPYATSYMNQRTGLLLFGAVILSAIVYQIRSRFSGPADIYWGLVVLWSISIPLVAKINWVHMHRALLLVSIPGIIRSLIELLQPDELAWSMKVGFSMYPRAFGLVSNPITNAEGLVIIACWSLARLSKVKGRERNWIIAHLIITVLIITFSRVRAGLIGMTLLLLIQGVISPRVRKICLSALSTLLVGFAMGLFIFGFNLDSISERLELQRNSLYLLAEYPVFGIGPDNFKSYEVPGSDLRAHSHNTILGLSTELGAIGLVAFILFMVKLGRRTYRLFEHHRQDDDGHMKWVTSAFFTVFVMFWVFGLFDYNFSDTELLIFHGYHWALTMRLPLPGETSQT